jgi:hypothetical protein
MGKTSVLLWLFPSSPEMLVVCTSLAMEKGEAHTDYI